MKKLLFFLLILSISAFANDAVKNPTMLGPFFSVGVKWFPPGGWSGSYDFRIYAEASLWTNYYFFWGADAGIEIGTKCIEFYGEAQTGLGFSGYSHGLYYRLPYNSSSYGCYDWYSCYGWRGKLWGGLGYYVASDFDYTKDNRGTSVFINSGVSQLQGFSLF
ncbi:MAG: hypothetical protein LBU89_09100 [Fibromonadaceae bacterium]|jgi:hypothetical protein|nr:hypothetical protein [Fibromonadaceae bacterium]